MDNSTDLFEESTAEFDLSQGADKPRQSGLTVTEFLNHPAVKAVMGKKHDLWTVSEADEIASFMANRGAITFPAGGGYDSEGAMSVIYEIEERSRVDSEFQLKCDPIVLTMQSIGAFNQAAYTTVLAYINSLQGGLGVAGAANQPLEFVNGWDRMVICNNEQTCGRLIGALCISFQGHLVCHRTNPNAIVSSVA